MSFAKRTRRPPSRPAKTRLLQSPESIAQAAVAHEGQAAPGGKVKLTLAVTLSRAQADRLTARAIAQGKNLNALAAELLEGARNEPSA